MQQLLTFNGLKQKGHPYTRSHTRRLIEKGLFPRPIHLGPGRIAWLEHEIDEWINERAAARDAEAKATE
jgi:prophage regulatory protein